MYYTGSHYFQGEILVSGGYGLDRRGGAGTVYIEDRSNSTQLYRTLMTKTYKDPDSERIHEVEKLDLRGASVAAVATTYYSYGNVSLSTDGPIYYYDTTIRQYSSFYSIMSGTVSDRYRTTRQDPTISITLPFTTFVDHVRVYPNCE